MPMVNSAPLYSFDCSREGLSYIAGFLAYKLSGEFPNLGRKTSEQSPLVNPSKLPWLSALSLGGLMQPTEAFFNQVESLEKLFREYYGSSISSEPNITKTFANFILSRHPNLPAKIAFKFSKVWISITLKFLNHQLQEQKVKMLRRHLNKVGHFLS